MVRWLSGLLLALVVAACGTTAPQPPSPQALLHDESFTPLAQPIDAGAVFAPSEAMRSYLRSTAKGSVFFHGSRAEWLVQSLYRPGELKIEYDAATTRNAAQAFDARAGNCLSRASSTRWA